MTITLLINGGTDLSFDGAAVHVTGMAVDVRPNAVITGASAADGKANTYQGIRPRGPEPA